MQMHVHPALRTHGIVSMITHVPLRVMSLTVTSLSDEMVAQKSRGFRAGGNWNGGPEHWSRASRPE
jgi:hypothetical protein